MKKFLSCFGISNTLEEWNTILLLKVFIFWLIFKYPLLFSVFSCFLFIWVIIWYLIIVFWNHRWWFSNLAQVFVFCFLMLYLESDFIFLYDPPMNLEVYDLVGLKSKCMPFCACSSWLMMLGSTIEIWS